ncbi:hypothetical protein [Acaryochloris sp. IP29b_bin.148]|nr:hypothetical protein [Acaryochloris sp. IP29b_bin.148]
MCQVIDFPMADQGESLASDIRARLFNGCLEASPLEQQGDAG